MKNVHREGKRLILVDDAVGPRHGFGRIAQQRIVDAAATCARLVRFGCIDANRKCATLNRRISSPLSRSDLHSAVQPLVNALANHASTTTCLPA